MNVFVLCTGRCGSTTLAEACRHMTNFTAAHESNWHRIGPPRLEYPDNHIEVDNRLSWMLGQLDRRYGGDAFYVHLQRDAEETAQSFDRRWNWEGSIIRAFSRAILAVPDQDIDLCRAYVECVNANIEMFLKDKPQSMTIDLEQVADAFPAFWRQIGAQGDLDAAIATFGTNYNASAAGVTPPVTGSGRRGLSRVLRLVRR